MKNHVRISSLTLKCIKNSTFYSISFITNFIILLKCHSPFNCIAKVRLCNGGLEREYEREEREQNKLDVKFMLVVDVNFPVRGQAFCERNEKDFLNFLS